ncbi:hypothetical protein BC826DRAFT_1111111 [Russula brevipes]|nr:hypothetical protein BC826DRAFT_1111111 [Russula brevipes]
MFTGRIEEAVFDIKINPIQSEATRIGCPAAVRRWDLWWPPVWGGSFWTTSLQHRALRGGARLGRAIGRGLDAVNEYDPQAALILD